MIEHTPAETTHIPTDRLHLLTDPNYGVLAVGKPDGSIIATPMWFLYRKDGTLAFTHTTRRGKFRALQSNPHMTFTVISPSDPGEYLEVRGVLDEVLLDPGGEFYKSLALRYDSWDGTPASDLANRVILVMRIDQALQG